MCQFFFPIFHDTPYTSLNLGHDVDHDLFFCFCCFCLLSLFGMKLEGDTITSAEESSFNMVPNVH